MGLMDKLKTQIDLWKLEKYTKRRQVSTPDFEQKGTCRVGKVHAEYQTKTTDIGKQQTEISIVTIIRTACTCINTKRQQ